MIVRSLLSAFCITVVCASSAYAEPSRPVKAEKKTFHHAFDAGEKLTYSVSWSKVVDAGIAVMEVKEGPVMDNRRTYHFVASTHSVGIVEQFYPIRDVVESIVDAQELYSLEFKVRESHGSETSYPRIKKRKRYMKFDQKKNSALTILNDDPPETFSISERVQDALSSLYYVRTHHDFQVEKPIVVTVFDSGKTWSVEIYTLGRERIKTPAGEFNTIHVKTYPKYEGVFMNKGEIFIWITDDERRIPVFMKSTITIGSIVATLITLETGKTAHDIKKRSQTAQ